MSGSCGDVRISGDGSYGGTRVMTLAGVEIKGLRSAVIEIHPEEPVIARLELLLLDIATYAKPQFLLTDPRDGRIRRVRSVLFEDGDTLDFAVLTAAPADAAPEGQAADAL